MGFGFGHNRDSCHGVREYYARHCRRYMVRLAHELAQKACHCAAVQPVESYGWKPHCGHCILVRGLLDNPLRILPNMQEITTPDKKKTQEMKAYSVVLLP